MKSLSHFIAAAAWFTGAWALAAAPSSTTIHVSPQGDDLSDGSAAHPLATLRAAQRVVFETLNRGVSRITVSIQPGDYRLDQPLVFRAQDGARVPSGEVKYMAAGGEVRIGGGRRITGWQQQGKSWVTKVTLDANNPPFRDLWVNGRRAIRARAPNEGYFRVDAAGPDNRTSFTVVMADLLSLVHPEQAEVAFLHDWSMSRMRLASIDPATRTYRFKDAIGSIMPQFAITNYEPHPRYFVEGAPELLDAPGEWLLDNARGTLTYIPREGEKLETAQIIAPRLDQLLTVRGDGGQPVMNLTFTGIAFRHTRYELPPHGYAGIQSAWHERRSTADDHADEMMPAAVVLDRTQNCGFRNCRFEHLAACGLQCIHDEGTRMNHCQFDDIGGDGALIGSASKSDAPISHGDVIKDSTIQNCGVTFSGAVGLWIGFASDITVAHNEIHHLPYSGVSVGWKWDDEPTPCRGNIIANNHIHEVMQILSDGGGIYTLGRQPGTRLSKNLIHGIPKNAGRAESNGIFMDQGSSEILVEGNTIYDVARAPIRFNMAGPNAIRDNRLAVMPGEALLLFGATDAKQMKLENNQELPGQSWKPASDDPVVKDAGPRAD